MSYRFKRMGVTICRATKLLRVTKWSHDVCYTMVTRKKIEKNQIVEKTSICLLHGFDAFADRKLLRHGCHERVVGFVVVLDQRGGEEDGPSC